MLSKIGLYRDDAKQCRSNLEQVMYIYGQDIWPMKSIYLSMEKKEPNAAGAMLLLVYFLLHLLRSLVFQKDKAKEKNKSKNRNF